jgi:hypothetical protein
MGGLNRGPSSARSRRERRYGSRVRRRMAAASSGGSSTAFTGVPRSCSVRVASPATRRFCTQPPSPYEAWTNMRPSSSTMPTGTVRGLPDRRPRTVRRTFGAPVGIPAAINRRTSGLSRRSSRPPARCRKSTRAARCLLMRSPSLSRPRVVGSPLHDLHGLRPEPEPPPAPRRAACQARSQRKPPSASLPGRGRRWAGRPIWSSSAPRLSGSRISPPRKPLGDSSVHADHCGSNP